MTSDGMRAVAERTVFLYNNGTVRSGTVCDLCGTTYAQCTTDLLGRKGSCCAVCRIRDSHDERTERVVEKPVERIRVHGWPYRPTDPQKR